VVEPDRERWRWIAGTALLAVAARLPGLLSGRPLWLDEAMVVEAVRSEGGLAALARLDLHPPLLAAILAALPTVEPWLVRLPSWLASVASVAAAAWAGGRWGGPAASRRFGLFAALCPPWVLYAGEARPYALALLLATLWIGELAAPRPARLGALVAVGVTVAWGLWPLLAGGAAVALARSPRRGRLAAALLPGLGVAAALVPLLAAQLSGPGRALTEGSLAALRVDGPAAAAWAAVGWVGWCFVGVRGAVGVAVGAAALVWAASSPGRREVDAALAALLAGFAAASVAGLHPFGPGRHLLVLTPLLGLAVSLRAGWGWAPVLVAGLWAQPPLPWHDVACALAAAPGPVWVDAGAAPAARLAAPDRVVGALPWVDPAAALPPGLVLLVVTPFPASAALRSGAETVATCRGAVLLRVGGDGASP
jgi:hypothetical protein